jgi:hypothetical protein
MNQPTINRPRIDPPLIPQVTWVRPLPDFALEIAFNTGEQGRLYLELLHWLFCSIGPGRVF